ncbi:uncharacterized protein LOC129598761 [Paramacrobiotus metropolitanus]|uniref:uncharacterized protein LOC129598761 n=1 Tax=Paramacrobiotus metropolitanus TaxID=2943436 RepID=UPI00244635C4|nr:uncharacterized protein LOC129598761 [Paramacrobiotus metropolitanus]
MSAQPVGPAGEPLPSPETDAIAHYEYWKGRTRESVQFAMAEPLQPNETIRSRRQLAMHTAAHACILEADITGYYVDMSSIKKFVVEMHDDFTEERVDFFLGDAINAGILLKKMSRDGRFVLEVAEEVKNNRDPETKVIDTTSKFRRMIRVILYHGRYAMSRTEIQHWICTFDVQLQDVDYWLERGLRQLVNQKHVVVVYGNLFVNSCIDLWLRSIRGCCLCTTLAQTINIKMGTMKVTVNGRDTEQHFADCSFGYVGQDGDLVVDGVMERLDAIEPEKNNTTNVNLVIRASKDGRIEREPIITLTQLKAMGGRPKYVPRSKNTDTEKKSQKMKEKAERPGAEVSAAEPDAIDKLLQQVEREKDIMENCKALVNTLKARATMDAKHIAYIREALEQRLANLKTAEENLDLD